jgi:hypothetical protein
LPSYGYKAPVEMNIPTRHLPLCNQPKSGKHFRRLKPATRGCHRPVFELLDGRMLLSAAISTLYTLGDNVGLNGPSRDTLLLDSAGNLFGTTTQTTNQSTPVIFGTVFEIKP